MGEYLLGGANHNSLTISTNLTPKKAQASPDDDLDDRDLDLDLDVDLDDDRLGINSKCLANGIKA